MVKLSNEGADLTEIEKEKCRISIIHVSLTVRIQNRKPFLFNVDNAILDVFGHHLSFRNMKENATGVKTTPEDGPT